MIYLLFILIVLSLCFISYIAGRVVERTQKNKPLTMVEAMRLMGYDEKSIKFATKGEKGAKRNSSFLA